MYPTIPKNTAKNGLRADRNEYTGVLFFRTGQLYLKIRSIIISVSRKTKSVSINDLADGERLEGGMFQYF